MLLRKHLSLDDVSLKMSDAGTGSFEGYASVFGGVDSYGDTILSGAFESSLRKSMPKMFFGHDWTMPIGKWTSAKEDGHGLYVKGELTPGLGLAGDVHAALKHGTLDGLSIGGYVKQGDYDTTETGRVIRKWSTLVEVSPVVFPADSAARIDSETVKGADLIEEINAVESIRDFESLLRDAAGLTKGAAVALTARARLVFGAGDPQETQTKAMQEIADRLARLAV